MRRLNTAYLTLFGLVILSASAFIGSAQSAPDPYPKMLPVERYLMLDREAEIALARSAAPQSVSSDASVEVLSRHGYEMAATGKNGFVCIVGRGWSSAPEQDFWNPNVRVPMCVNAAAARSYLLYVFRMTDLALSGHAPSEVDANIAAAVNDGDLPRMKPGSMCYMMSKEGNGGEVLPHWPSHLMFFFTGLEPEAWGANGEGAPIFAAADSRNHLTQFVIPVPKWSDGTDAILGTAHTHP